jgi:hypothetical protein
LRAGRGVIRADAVAGGLADGIGAYLVNLSVPGKSF